MLSQKGSIVLLPSFSIIVNTNGRAESLERTIESFKALDYPNFEVCVVVGPTRDTSQELAQRYADAGLIKYRDCGELNLSKSRNIGIAMAAGDVIAFIDDDGIPEPEWLSDLAQPYTSADVVGVGGCTYDHTGHSFQARFMLCDRLGNAELMEVDPNSADYCYPFATRYAGLLGTNSSFRRSAVVAIGGFNEEYEYYLDETDLCVRLIDNGGVIKQLPRGFVHHKFLPSHLRNEHRALSVPFPVMKNKIYFPMVNGRRHHSMTEIIRDATRFFDTRRADIEWCVANGRLESAALDTFDETSDRAWKVGIERGLSGLLLTQPANYFADPKPLLQFPTVRPRCPRRNFVFLSQSYPPGVRGGNARHTHDIASAIAGLGHTVRVLTRGTEFNRVDLEDGVWVHRIVSDSYPQPGDAEQIVMPQHLWDHAASMLREVRRIDSHVPVDAIESVSWDCEGAAAVLDGQFPTAINIVTGFAQYLNGHPELAADEDWMRGFGTPMLKMEGRILQQASTLVAASQAIVETLSLSSGVALEEARISRCQHGLLDMRERERAKPPSASLTEGLRAVLFVGRLEMRKGVDVLLEVIPDLLTKYSDVVFWLAGDDTERMEGGQTMREVFESSSVSAEVSSRVTFFGAVSDEELRWLYANCYLFVAPSRFESFGLIFVEAMMFAKPVVGTAAGGIPEVVDHGKTGLLARPGDPTDLHAMIDSILSDADMAQRFGKAGRSAFESRFQAKEVAKLRVTVLESLLRDEVPPDRRIVKGASRLVKVGENIKIPADAVLLELDSCIEIISERNFVYVTFQRHAWSGFASISSDIGSAAKYDLYASHADFVTQRVDVRARGGRFLVSRRGQKNEKSNSDEVIIAAITEGDL